MNAPRFYCREALAPGALVELPAPVVRHAVRVLRLGPGDPVVLFDGRGGEYPALLQRIEKERAWAELGAWQDVECESPLAITVCMYTKKPRAHPQPRMASMWPVCQNVFGRDWRGAL